MADARDQILGRIRAALVDVPDSERAADVPVVREYRRRDERPHDELVALFARRVSDYRARVHRVAAAGLADAIRRACAERRLQTLAVAPGLPDAWLPSELEIVRDDVGGGAELDRVDGALTGCAAAIAETGTIVLDGGRLSGRRALTLVPDHHICVVGGDQIHGQIAQALAAVAAAVTEQRAPITLVSGPSATSDIELERVEGVHGPRNLIVLIVEGARAPEE
jgi:L-lactate dehydrogenase complex protein LldG